MAEKFGGADKVGTSFLLSFEKKLKRVVVPKIPNAIETYHLTLLTLLWSALNIALAFLARDQIQWLWVVSLLIVFQYLTDLFDGELGRYRNTGLIKWGFYMDHLFDYIFLCSLVFVGYMICPEDVQGWYIALLSVLGAFMASSFLSFAATNEFEIYKFGMGPTEGRFVVIVINALIVLRGTGDFYFLLPASVFALAIAFTFYVYGVHKKLWALDMEIKKNAHPPTAS